jgi:hypothetical protein
MLEAVCIVKRRQSAASINLLILMRVLVLGTSTPGETGADLSLGCPF